MSWSSITEVSTYRPTWHLPSGSRVPGRDEDVVTMAVAAARPIVESGRDVERIVFITPLPPVLDGDTAVALQVALGCRKAPVTQRLGGAVATLDALLDADAGTLVIAADHHDDAGAAAALLGQAGEGAVLVDPVRSSAHVPVAAWPLGEAAARSYDDPRLHRDLALFPAAQSVAKNADPTHTITCGAPLRPGIGAQAAEASGAHGPIAAVAQMTDVSTQIHLIATDTGGALHVVVQTPSRVEACAIERRPLPLPDLVVDASVEIPMSLAAYSRAFESKLGLLASECIDCGTLEYPPRSFCVICGSADPARWESVDLPRTGSVYTLTTIRTPVPGLASPYTLAIIELDDVDVHVLVPLTDATPGSVGIGTAGRLVLRRVAQRIGLPDYGPAFQPLEDTP